MLAKDSEGQKKDFVHTQKYGEKYAPSLVIAATCLAWQNGERARTLWSYVCRAHGPLALLHLRKNSTILCWLFAWDAVLVSVYITFFTLIHMTSHAPNVPLGKIVRKRTISQVLVIFNMFLASFQLVVAFTSFPAVFFSMLGSWLIARHSLEDVKRARCFSINAVVQDIKCGDVCTKV